MHILFHSYAVKFNPSNSDVFFYKSIIFQFTLAWKLASDSNLWEKLSSSSFLQEMLSYIENNFGKVKLD